MAGVHAMMNVDPAPLNDKIQKLEARIKALEDEGE